MHGAYCCVIVVLPYCILYYTAKYGFLILGHNKKYVCNNYAIINQSGLWFKNTKLYLKKKYNSNEANYYWLWIIVLFSEYSILCNNMTETICLRFSET